MRGHLVLPHPGQLLQAVLGDEGDDVRGDAEACAGHLEVVGHDHVQLFPLQLGLGVGDHILGLHGEAADEQTGVPILGHPAQKRVSEK